MISRIRINLLLQSPHIFLSHTPRQKAKASYGGIYHLNPFFSFLKKQSFLFICLFLFSHSQRKKTVVISGHSLSRYVYHGVCFFSHFCSWNFETLAFINSWEKERERKKKREKERVKERNREKGRNKEREKREKREREREGKREKEREIEKKREKERERKRKK